MESGIIEKRMWRSLREAINGIHKAEAGYLQRLRPILAFSV